MTVLPMRFFGDPVLRSVADPVSFPVSGDPSSLSQDATLATLVADMLETMDHYGGVGLAANQVGVTRRVFVYDCEGDRGHVINPEWEPVGDEVQVGPEGCLSIPGIRGDVQRAETVVVRGVTLDGTPVERQVSGLLARCVQHETDHLDGVMFLKHLSKDDRRAAMAQIRQAEWFNN